VEQLISSSRFERVTLAIFDHPWPALHSKETAGQRDWAASDETCSDSLAQTL